MSTYRITARLHRLCMLRNAFHISDREHGISRLSLQSSSEEECRWADSRQSCFGDFLTSHPEWSLVALSRFATRGWNAQHGASVLVDVIRTSSQLGCGEIRAAQRTASLIRPTHPPCTRLQRLVPKIGRSRVNVSRNSCWRFIELIIFFLAETSSAIGPFLMSDLEKNVKNSTIKGRMKLLIFGNKMSHIAHQKVQAPKTCKQ